MLTQFTAGPTYNYNSGELSPALGPINEDLMDVTAKKPVKRKAVDVAKGKPKKRLQSSRQRRSRQDVSSIKSSTETWNLMQLQNSQQFSGKMDQSRGALQEYVTRQEIERLAMQECMPSSREKPTL